MVKDLSLAVLNRFTSEVGFSGFSLHVIWVRLLIEECWLSKVNILLGAEVYMMDGMVRLGFLANGRIAFVGFLITIVTF